LELVVQVYNINQGHNAGILKKCEKLDNYSFLIDKIREYQKEGFSLEEALRNAIEYCIEHDKLKDFLEEHSSEVHNMLITAKYDPKEEMEAHREEAWEYGLEEGLEQGREQGIMDTARNALAKGLSIETVQEITGLDLEVIERLANEQ
jgi:predicted transposase/invertase (TIGR01784 family)